MEVSSDFSIVRLVDLVYSEAPRCVPPSSDLPTVSNTIPLAKIGSAVSQSAET
jgi:hypothetical protein